METEKINSLLAGEYKSKPCLLPDECLVCENGICSQCRHRKMRALHFQRLEKEGIYWMEGEE